MPKICKGNKMKRMAYLGGVLFLLVFGVNAMEEAADLVYEMPTRCPSIDIIKTLQITAADMVQVKTPYFWTDPNGFRRRDPGIWETRGFSGSFGTDKEWTFSIRSVQALSAEVAAREAQQTLLALRLKEGPRKIGYTWLYDWRCSYDTPDAKSASATLRREPNLWAPTIRSHYSVCHKDPNQ